MKHNTEYRLITGLLQDVSAWRKADDCVCTPLLTRDVLMSIIDGAPIRPVLLWMDDISGNMTVVSGAWLFDLRRSIDLGDVFANRLFDRWRYYFGGTFRCETEQDDDALGINISAMMDTMELLRWKKTHSISTVEECELEKVLRRLHEIIIPVVIMRACSIKQALAVVDRWRTA